MLGTRLLTGAGSISRAQYPHGLKIILTIGQVAKAGVGDTRPFIKIKGRIYYAGAARQKTVTAALIQLT